MHTLVDNRLERIDVTIRSKFWCNIDLHAIALRDPEPDGRD
jgi:hypothetical protein